MSLGAVLLPTLPFEILFLCAESTPFRYGNIFGGKLAVDGVSVIIFAVNFRCIRLF